MKHTLILAALSLALAACGGGDDTHTIETHTVETVVEKPVIVPGTPEVILVPVAPGEAKPEPIDTTPPVVLPPACKPDPQPTHGKDPACR